MGCGEDAEKSAALQLSADALESIVTGSPKEGDGYHLRLARMHGGEKVKVG
jgi:hypothetical protein